MRVGCVLNPKVLRWCWCEVGGGEVGCLAVVDEGGQGVGGGGGDGGVDGDLVFAVVVDQLQVEDPRVGRDGTYPRPVTASPARVSQHHAGPGPSLPVVQYPARRQRATIPRSRSGRTSRAAASRSYGAPYMSPHNSSPATSRLPSRTIPASARRVKDPGGAAGNAVCWFNGSRPCRPVHGKCARLRGGDATLPHVVTADPRPGRPGTGGPCALPGGWPPSRLRTSGTSAPRLRARTPRGACPGRRAARS